MEEDCFIVMLLVCGITLFSVAVSCLSLVLVLSSITCIRGYIFQLFHVFVTHLMISFASVPLDLVHFLFVLPVSHLSLSFCVVPVLSSVSVIIYHCVLFLACASVSYCFCILFVCCFLDFGICLGPFFGFVSLSGWTPSFEPHQHINCEFLLIYKKAL